MFRTPDIEFIRENPDLVKRAAAAKGFEVDLYRLIALDTKRRELMKNTNSLRERLNRLSKQIPTLSAAERTPAVEDVRQLKAQLAVQDTELDQVTSQYNELMLVVPNVPGDDVPPGKSDADNVEIKRLRWGTVREFDFEPKDHLELETARAVRVRTLAEICRRPQLQPDRSWRHAGACGHSVRPGERCGKGFLTFVAARHGSSVSADRDGLFSGSASQTPMQSKATICSLSEPRRSALVAQHLDCIIVPAGRPAAAICRCLTVFPA